MTEKPKFENNLQTSIPCGDCDKKLIVKTNRATGSQFLGCPDWPECLYTRPIPESWIMRVNGQEELL